MSSGSGERAPGRTNLIALYLRLSWESVGGECQGNIGFIVVVLELRPLLEKPGRAIIELVAVKLHSNKALPGLDPAGLICFQISDIR